MKTLFTEEERVFALSFRRDLHQHPECSLNEHRTTEKIKEKLTSWDIEILDLGLETGVVASVGLHKTDKTIALRGDIDALPLNEASRLPFSSLTAGVAHCCGHDLHTTALLLAAKKLKSIETQIPGRVLFIFQPAEENFGGAKIILNTELITHYHPEFIVGLHTWPEVPAGSIGYKPGPAMAASDSLKITVYGRGGHGAHPHKSIDPICMAGYLVTAIQSIVSRNISPLQSAVITIGKISGGTALNVIPDEVVMEGTVRSLTPEIRDLVQTRLEQMLPTIAEGFCGQCKVEYRRGGPPLINNDKVLAAVVHAGEKVLGKEHVVELKEASMGSEDFAEYMEKIPGALFRIGTRNENPQSHLPLHNTKIIFDEEAIFVGAATYVQLVKDVFSEEI